MKTILKLSVVVLVAITTMSSSPIDGDFILNVKKETGKQISFCANRIQKARVTIYDKDYTIIYSEIVTGKGGIMRTYSLDEFPNGEYLLEVETNLKKVTHEIAITHESPILSRRPIAEVYRGELKIKNRNVATNN